jgi:hypothetical protein
MVNDFRILVSLSAVAVLPLGCGGGFMPTSRYASATDAPPDSAWSALGSGRRIVVSSTAGCPVTASASLRDLEAGRAGPLTGPGAQLLTIRDSLVNTGAEPFVALEVAGRGGAPFWLKLPVGNAACVNPAPAHVDQLSALAGSRVVFAPWKPECSELAAVGTAPASVLTASNDGAAFEVGSFEMGSIRALDFAANKPGNGVWLTLGGGSLRVREDVLKSCFARPEEPAARRPQSLEPLVKIAESRCQKSDDGGKAHVECRTSLGVWEGQMTDGALELSLVRRTLGPVHFLNDRPVNGARYARAIVAVTQGDARDSRGQALYAALDHAVRNAVGTESGGDVRITSPSARDVTYRVHVEVSELQIGELVTRELTETTEYKAGEDVRPNPKKPEALKRVETARQDLQQEEESYRRAVALFDEAKRVALEECQAKVNSMEDGVGKQLAQSGCNVAGVAGGLVQPSDSDLESARTELSEAESALEQMPDTITVPIMKPWSYTKRMYSRSTSAVLALSMQPVDSAQPAVKRIPLAHQWSDYEVQADPAHNVKGHSPDRNPIQNAEALVPFIAQQASHTLASELRSAISDAAIERAVKAFRASGNAPPQPGFETVDALAFDAAGKRLKRVEFRDRAQVPKGGSFALPAAVAQLGAGECLLAVAVGSDASTLDVALYTPDRRHADFRGGRAAMIEVCRAELGAASSVERMLLESRSGGEARWGVYRTVER